MDVRWSALQGREPPRIGWTIVGELLLADLCDLDRAVQRDPLDVGALPGPVIAGQLAARPTDFWRTMLRRQNHRLRSGKRISPDVPDRLGSASLASLPQESRKRRLFTSDEQPFGIPVELLLVVARLILRVRLQAA